MARRYLPWVVLLSATLHVVGIARTVMPAQDGLKFVRVAREFGRQPWADVIRGSDQHPLYPIGIALAQPVVSTVIDRTPDAWRIAAQGVSMTASLLTLFPLFGFTRNLFGERTALLATGLFALLPATCSIGHDTLSDALALSLFTTALWCGERAVRSGGLAACLGCGLASGLAYWTRPEMAVLPVSILAVVVGRALLMVSARSTGGSIPESWTRGLETRRVAILTVSFLALVGVYALLKGEVSEKLALRRGAAIASTHDAPKRIEHGLPPGLDDPRFDFSPKEESARLACFGPLTSLIAVARVWTEGLAWVFAPLALLGAWRVPARSVAGRWLAAMYVALFGAILARHAMGLGYLSGRHALTLVVVALPWAAAGCLEVGRRLSHRFQWDAATSRRAGQGAVIVMAIALVGLQVKPAHASRWGHRAAGLWLAEHADAGQAVLDTRGWAAFVAGLPSYDYWHVRQALTDSRLSYVVVGADELEAGTPRSATLRALLDHAGELLVAFPSHEGGSSADVRVYRFTHPSSWEGIRP